MIDRFGQIEPKVLLAIDGYRFGDRAVPVLDRMRTIRGALPSVRATVLLPYLDADAEAIPRTLTGKKLEVPVKRILPGAPAAAVASDGALLNPGSLAPFERLAKGEARNRP